MQPARIGRKECRNMVVSNLKYKVFPVIIITRFSFYFQALVDCQYYVTSENKYVDYFSIDELAKTVNSTILQIKFSTISREMIKFRLSQNDTIESDTNEPSGEGPSPSKDSFKFVPHPGISERLADPPSEYYDFCKFCQIVHEKLNSVLIFN